MSNGVKFIDGFMGEQHLIEEQVLELFSTKNYTLSNILQVPKATDILDVKLFEKGFIFQAKQALNGTRSTLNQGHLKSFNLLGNGSHFCHSWMQWSSRE